MYRVVGNLIYPVIVDEKGEKIDQLRRKIKEANRKLDDLNWAISTDCLYRSPSPDPIYNGEGVRINTRLQRCRSRLLTERNNAIAQMKELDPSYKPPKGFRTFKPPKQEERVLLPAEEHPHINFIGLVLGPRGNHLKKLKQETGCFITIKGKGSLRTGMTGITKNGKSYKDTDGPLHAYICGPTAENVAKAAKKIQDLIHLYIYSPESEEAVKLREKNLHELAMLNGTVKESKMKCSNCRCFGHKSWECDRPSAVICLACGGGGHSTSDCKRRRPGAIFGTAFGTTETEVEDKEYQSFVKDLTGKQPIVGRSFNGEFVTLTENVGKCLGQGPAPLMLTNGSAAPGAASAFARSIKAPPVVNNSMRFVGKSIFGGKMSKMTSGYKSKFEIELEKARKKQEFEYQPVPMEWQVERYEKMMNNQQDQYVQQLEQYCAAQKKKKLESSSIDKNVVDVPPPQAVGSWETSFNMDLPNIIGNPLMGFIKK